MSPSGPERRSAPPADATPGVSEAQRERAQQTWALHVEEDPESLDPERARALFRTLRVKRFERSALLARLPGVVRRGARVDLLPLVEDLVRAGIEARLERRPSSQPQEPDTER